MGPECFQSVLRLASIMYIVVIVNEHGNTSVGLVERIKKKWAPADL